MKIEVWQGKGKQWYWHFRARNGRITACAEAFPTKSNAIRAARAVVRAVVKDWRYISKQIRLVDPTQ